LSLALAAVHAVIDSVIKKLIQNKKYTIPQEQLFADQTQWTSTHILHLQTSWYSDEMYYASRCMEHASLWRFSKGPETRFMTVSTFCHAPRAQLEHWGLAC
jgi:hypothetical protein